MLRLRERIVSHLLSSSFTSTSAISPLRRLLSAAAAAAPNSPIQGFAVEDYLVDTCGLTRPQALKASTKLSHLKSPANPNAVLAFLSGLGLSSADAAAVVAKDPLFLCAGVERTLGPVVDGLSGLGLSRPEIARLLPLVRDSFRRRSVVSKMHYYLPLFGSFGNFLRALQRGSYLLSSNLDKVVKPNVMLLRECGLGDCDITKLCISEPRMLGYKPERVQAMVACAEGLGVPRGSGMFRVALQAVAFLSEEKIAAKVDYLKKTFGWSDAEVVVALSVAPMLLKRSKDILRRRFEFLVSEVGLEPGYISEEKIAAKVDYLKKTFGWSDAEVVVALSVAPMLLKRSKDILRRRFEFLVSEVGLEPGYIAHRPVMLYYSLEGRLKPRYYVLRFLKENGLLDRDWSFYTAVTRPEKYFINKCICPHKEAAPRLAEDYAAACRGEVPAIFRSA